MRRRATESALLLAMAACGAAPGSGADRAPSATMLPAATPDASAPVVASAAPADPPGFAGTAATAAAAPAAPSSSAGDALPPPRPATISLASGSGQAGDSDLTAGDDALERGDLAAAERSYAAARVAGAKSGAAVGLARVRLARTGLPLDYGVAKGNVAVVAVATDLARVAKEAPAFGPAFVELGRARLLGGDASGAIDALKRGVELLPDEPEAHSQLGVAWLATGHADQAVRELSRSAELDPGSGARHGNLGTALMMTGRTKEAITQYELHARIDDDDARAHSDLGTALLATNDLERSLSELTRATGLAPNRASFHSNLGYALQQAGRLDRAVAEYREAIRLDPALASAWINLATVLAKNPATRRDARAALARAAAASPDDPRVKANLDELNALEKGIAPPSSAPPDASSRPKFPSSP
jgi:Flp pilus assembly protein TadD